MHILGSLACVAVFAVVRLASVAAQGGCKSPLNINATDGVISSPYYQFYPSLTYPLSLKCQWKITVPEGNNIRVTFFSPPDIQVGPAGSCSQDWLAFGKRGSQPCSQSDLVAGPFCGNVRTPPESFVLSGNTIDVHFCTDGVDGDYQGFQLIFNASSDAPSPTPSPTPPPPPTTCGGNFYVWGNGSTQSFTSPNFPESYPNNAICTWIFQTNPSYAVVLSPTVFGLENSTGCNSDYLEITELSSENRTNTFRFCGITNPGEFRFTSSAVKVVFRSDSSVSNVGFYIKVDNSKCPIGAESCPNADEGICFRQEQLCDGKLDCPGGTDEVCPLGCGIPAKTPVFRSIYTRIVGGTEAKPHSWPWQVALLDQQGVQFCGGAIIDRHWVATSGHCCRSAGSTQQLQTRYLKVRVGEHDLRGNLEVNQWDYSLARVITHPRYGATPVSHHDICLLKTMAPIFFNDDVHPVCISSDTEPPVGTDCYVVGWGLADAPEENREVDGKASVLRPSNVLQQAVVKIVADETCKRVYREALITEDMFCAYNPGKDSCTRDSGGPLVCRSRSDPESFELTGIVSWGAGCAQPGVPGVYARTSYFLDWIAETIMAD